MICRGKGRALLHNVWYQDRFVHKKSLLQPQFNDLLCKKFKVHISSYSPTISNRPIKNCQATAFHYPPRTVMMEDEDGKPHVHGGYEYQIFVTIAKKLK